MGKSKARSAELLASAVRIINSGRVHSSNRSNQMSTLTKSSQARKITKRTAVPDQEMSPRSMERSDMRRIANSAALRAARIVQKDQRVSAPTTPKPVGDSGVTSALLLSSRKPPVVVKSTSRSANPTPERRKKVSETQESVPQVPSTTALTGSMLALRDRVKSGQYVRGANKQYRSNDEVAVALDGLEPTAVVRILVRLLNDVGVLGGGNPYAALNLGQQSMNLRNKLRGAVRAGKVTLADVAKAREQ